MRPDISPMNPIWSAYADFIRKNADEMSLRIKWYVAAFVISVPLFMGIFITYKSIGGLMAPERSFYIFGAFVGIAFGMICLFIAYMVLRTFFLDLTLFRKSEKKVHIKRGKFSGSIEQILNFSDIAMFQVIEYRNRNSENKSMVYELNMVLIDSKRINLTCSNKHNVVKNAKKISSFTKRPIKVFRH